MERIAYSLECNWARLFKANSALGTPATKMDGGRWKPERNGRKRVVSEARRGEDVLVPS